MPTDAEIINAVRSGTHVLVPKGGLWEVGKLDLDAFEAFEGMSGLVVQLTKEQCRDVALKFLE